MRKIFDSTRCLLFLIFPWLGAPGESLLQERLRCAISAPAIGHDEIDSWRPLFVVPPEDEFKNTLGFNASENPIRTLWRSCMGLILRKIRNYSPSLRAHRLQPLMRFHQYLTFPAWAFFKLQALKTPKVAVCTSIFSLLASMLTGKECIFL